MVILFLCDPAMYVFLLHRIPVIQVFPEVSSGLRDGLVQMQACDIVDAIDSTDDPGLPRLPGSLFSEPGDSRPYQKSLPNPSVSAYLFPDP